jgi:hypothetical protein
VAVTVAATAAVAVVVVVAAVAAKVVLVGRSGLEAPAEGLEVMPRACTPCHTSVAKFAKYPFRCMPSRINCHVWLLHSN